MEVLSSGRVTLQSGAITNNTNYNITGGGGVLVQSSGHFIMKGGTISGNKVTSTGGGGVYLAAGGIFTMTGGTIASNTTTSLAIADGGGGVCVDAGGIFTMENGTITGNGDPYNCKYGGGVMVQGQFTMSGGTITTNHCNNSGAGVIVNSTGIFTIHRPAGQGSISGNNDNTSSWIQVQSSGIINGSAGITAGW